MFLQGFYSVFGAGGREAATGWFQWRNADLIKPDEQPEGKNKNFF